MGHDAGVLARAASCIAGSGALWPDNRRLLEPIGYVPPAEYEARYYDQAAVA
jgi:hypothetical protein